MPNTDSIAPTDSHTERYRSSSHSDRYLYAMLAFIGYAWSRMLCATAVRLRTVVCVPFFRFFFSYLVLPACHRRPLLPYSYTYTQQRMLTARVISSPSSVVLTDGITNGSLSPECFLYVQRTAYDPWYHEWIPLPRVLLVRTAYIVSRPHLFSAACLIRVHGT